MVPRAHDMRNEFAEMFQSVLRGNPLAQQGWEAGQCEEKERDESENEKKERGIRGEITQRRQDQMLGEASVSEERDRSAGG